jgi:hypothetical protein
MQQMTCTDVHDAFDVFLSNMQLRDDFANSAMAAAIAHKDACHLVDFSCKDFEYISIASYQMAEQMMAARKETHGIHA